MDYANIVNTIGVSLILLAFLLLNMKKVKPTDKLYHILNFTGAGIACYGAVLINSMPFVVLEAIWAGVALFSLFRD